MSSTTTTMTGQPFDKALLEQLMRRRMFYAPSFEVYGNVEGMDRRGLFDYGPAGSALQANILALFRRHFILKEKMLELDCTALTPYAVFKTSGHVDKFSDFMVKDVKTGEVSRADHVVEGVLEGRLKGDKIARGQSNAAAEAPDDPAAKKKKKKVKDVGNVKLDDGVVQEYEEILAKIDNYNGDELGELIKKYNIKDPETGNDLTDPVPFNLMFSTSIGPSSNAAGFLRPETAQGQFLNFAKLLDFNNNRMPFASVCIGKSYRNEISPRGGLLRVREFLMAEIEHFVDPNSGKKHRRFRDVADMEVALLNRDTQLSGKTDIDHVTIGEAVSKKIVDNETLGYFLARIQLFMLAIGVDLKKLRFRQHMANEMAHYAVDCWDCELLTSSGWIECVGCADRSAYDLTVHQKRTGEPLFVREPLKEPVSTTQWEVELNKKKFGPHFKKDGKTIEDAIMALSQDVREKLSMSLKSDGQVSIPVQNVQDPSHNPAVLPKELITIEQKTRIDHIREYTPNVIEPSFGIGRILYSMIEHVFWTRSGDEARGVLSFPPAIAPTKVLLVPLSNDASFDPAIEQLEAKLDALGISSSVDDSSASIGKRYSRHDELGTPLGITVDFQSVKDQTFTLRDRDSTKQVRDTEEKILDAIRNIVDGRETWAQVYERLPKFEGQELD